MFFLAAAKLFSDKKRKKASREKSSRQYITDNIYKDFFASQIEWEIIMQSKRNLKMRKEIKCLHVKTQACNNFSSPPTSVFATFRLKEMQNVKSKRDEIAELPWL